MLRRRLPHTAVMQVKYYRYEQQPCVSLAFYGDAKTIRKFSKSGSPSERGPVSFCANPLAVSAGAVCCESSDLLSGVDSGQCRYKWENMKYDTMVGRCASQSMVPCGAYTSGGWTTELGTRCNKNFTVGEEDPARSCPMSAPNCVDTETGEPLVYSGIYGECVTNDMKPAPHCEYFTTKPDDDESSSRHSGWIPSFSWTNEACTLQAEVGPDGSIFIMQSASDSTVRVPVKVKWEMDTYPLAATCDSMGECQSAGGSCLCDVTESTSAVFADASNIPSKEEVLSQLHIGAAPRGKLIVIAECSMKAHTYTLCHLGFHYCELSWCWGCLQNRSRMESMLNVPVVRAICRQM